MSGKWVVAIIISIIALIWFSHHAAYKQQCDTKTKYYVSGGKFYYCDNYHAP